MCTSMRLTFLHRGQRTETWCHMPDSKVEIRSRLQACRAYEMIRLMSPAPVKLPTTALLTAVGVCALTT